MNHTDILVVGGGPIGAAFALSAIESGLRVTVLEAKAEGDRRYDSRTLALSYGSKLILERLEVWSRELAPTAIETIHVSQRGGFGRTSLSAREVGVPALGYVVNYTALAQALQRALCASPVDYRSGATVTKVNSTAEYGAIDFLYRDAAATATAKLVVLADGGHNLQGAQGVDPRQKDYRQSAVVGLVRSAHPHNHIAYERFTPDGPAALLPSGDRFAFVWTTRPQYADELLAVSDAEFVHRLHDHLGDRVGRFSEVGKRSAFPLSLRYARPVVAGRVVRIGNAAQALHPVAGQGFNLGLRDAWQLGNQLRNDPSGIEACSSLLEDYRRSRSLDTRAGIGVTDFLVRGFSSDLLPLRHARGLALQALDSVPALRKFFTRKMIFGASG